MIGFRRSYLNQIDKQAEGGRVRHKYKRMEWIERSERDLVYRTILFYQFLVIVNTCKGETLDLDQ